MGNLPFSFRHRLQHSFFQADLRCRNVSNTGGAPWSGNGVAKRARNSWNASKTCDKLRSISLSRPE